jgi:threonylcarbamoyladenosine tRNA methylthiotransferase MtaB
VTFSIVTFGCRVNQADSLALESALGARGAMAAPLDTADLVIVNTCSVTGSADQGARQLIRRVNRANAKARIVVTGCYATRAPEATDGLPGVVRLVSNDDKDTLVDQVLSELDGAHTPFKIAGECGVGPGPGVMGRTAYSLRVQTGCDEHCAFCIIPTTRGKSQSQPVASLSAEVARLGRAGFKEIWLVGVHLGSYGRDLDPPTTLVDLLRELDRVPGCLGFRLGSLEPMDCTPALIDLVSRSGRLAAHFHLPLQHATDRMLRAMRRPYDVALYRALVDRIRQALPQASIGADLIVGFPGETCADFDLCARSIADMPLSYLHVFPYSDRPGTESAQLTPKVRDIDIHDRARALRALGRQLSDSFARRQIGTVRPGLTLEDGAVVLTDNYLKVSVPPGRARNERVHVRIDRMEPGLTGTVIDSS